MTRTQREKEHALSMLFEEGGDDFIKTIEFKRHHHDVHLDAPVDEPKHYRELVSLLFNASEEDTFNFYINTPGGFYTSMLAIIEGVKNTMATCRAVIVGECHSAGSFIAMHCHEIAVLDSAHMMIHTANYGSEGNTGNVKAHAEFTANQLEKIIDQSYSGFLNKEEITKVKMGVEIWLDADEIRTRFESRTKYLESKMRREAKEFTLELEPKPKSKGPKKDA